MYMVAGWTQLSNASASKDQIATRLSSEESNGRRRTLACPPSGITAPNPPGRPHDTAGPDIVNPTAAGAAANPAYVIQDRSGCYFCIRHDHDTKLRKPKAVTAPKGYGKFQSDLSTSKIGPKSGSTHPTAGAAVAEPTRHQDQTGCSFSIRHADDTKLRNPKAVPDLKVCGKFQPDLSTLKNGPKSGSAHGASTTGITHKTKPKGEIIQNGLVSGPSGTLKAGSSSQTVPQGTKAVLQPQAAEITEIALKILIGPNAVTHMAEAKREVIIQDTDTIFSGCAQMGNSLGSHSEVNGVVKLPEPSITPFPDHHLNVPRGKPPVQPDSRREMDAAIRQEMLGSWACWRARRALYPT